MMHPATELRFISDEIGWGVFASERIPRGTITWTTDQLDQRFTRKQVEALHPLSRSAVHRYAYVDPRGLHVLCWDHGRFVNHSCDPNCLSAGFQFEFAIRDIEAGEQLTDDYGLMNLDEPMPCQCGSAKCRELIDGRDIEAWAEAWDGMVASAFEFIGKVDQPLWPLVAEVAEIDAVLRGKRPIPSCRALQCRV